MNEGKINAPGSSNTGITTTSGDPKEVVYIEGEGVIQLEDPYICPNCKSKNVPQPYSNLLFPLKGLEENYRMNVIIYETGIIESKTFSQLPKIFREKIENGFGTPPQGCKFWYLGKNSPV